MKKQANKQTETRATKQKIKQTATTKRKKKKKTWLSDKQQLTKKENALKMKYVTIHCPCPPVILLRMTLNSHTVIQDKCSPGWGDLGLKPDSE